MNLARYIHHSLLKPTTNLADIEKFCAEARTCQFTSVCVPPLYVRKTKELLEGTEVKVATVIGFPFGYNAIEAKVAEIVLAIVDGADELDMVANISAIKNGDWTFIANEINTIMSIVSSKGKLLKVIIESGVLSDDEIIKCCDIYGAAGVDYVGTSSGYFDKGATLHAIRLIRTHLSDAIKVEASGGIHSYSFAKEMINSGANRIGTSSSVKILEEREEAKRLVTQKQ